MTEKNPRSGLLAMIAACALLYGSSGLAALDGYLEVTDSNGQSIVGEGENADVGLTGQFEIDEFHHLIRDAGANSTDHRTAIVMTPLGLGLPRLLAALDSGEPLQMVLRFIEANAEGSSVVSYVITLGNARIVAFEPIMADNRVDATLPVPYRVRLRIEYDQIEYSYPPLSESVQLQN